MQLFPGQTEVAERPGILTYPEAGAIINRCLFSFDKNSPSEEKVGSQTGVAGAGSALPRGLSSGWVSETHRGWSVCGGKHAYTPPRHPEQGCSLEEAGEVLVKQRPGRAEGQAPACPWPPCPPAESTAEGSCAWGRTSAQSWGPRPPTQLLRSWARVGTGG